MCQDAGLSLELFNELRLLKKQILLQMKHKKYLQIKELIDSESDRERLKELGTQLRAVTSSSDLPKPTDLDGLSVKCEAFINDLKDHYKRLMTSEEAMNCENTLSDFTRLYEEWRNPL